MKSSPLIWRYVVSVKWTVKISSIFVAFLENMNFNAPRRYPAAPPILRKTGWTIAHPAHLLVRPLYLLTTLTSYQEKEQ